MRNKVEHKLIVNFEIRNSYGVLIVKTASNLLENLWNGTRNETSVFVILHASAHSERLSSTSLPINHNCAIESVNDRSNDITGAVIEKVVLTGVMQNFIEFESPCLLLIVHHSMLIFRNVYIDVLYVNQLNIWLRFLTFEAVSI